MAQRKRVSLLVPGMTPQGAMVPSPGARRRLLPSPPKDRPSPLAHRRATQTSAALAHAAPSPRTARRSLPAVRPAGHGEDDYALLERVLPGRDVRGMSMAGLVHALVTDLPGTEATAPLEDLLAEVDLYASPAAAPTVLLHQLAVQMFQSGHLAVTFLNKSRRKRREKKRGGGVRN